MTQKMQMSDFSVNKYKSFVVDSREKKFMCFLHARKSSCNETIVLGNKGNYSRITSAKFLHAMP